MTAIERAEAMLTMVESRCAGCTCNAPPPQPCGPHCEYPYPDERQPACGNCTAREAVRTAVPSKAELLRGYIGAVTALGIADAGLTPRAESSGWPSLREAVDGATADFERLFPAESQEQPH